MADTKATLEQIRDLLKEEPPQSRQALRLVKDLVIHGVCAREVDGFRHATIMLLERFVQPVVSADREDQARVGRMIRHVRTDRVFHMETVASHIEAIKPGMEGKSVRIQTQERAAPPFPAKLLREVLITLGGQEVGDLLPTSREPTWEQMYLKLGAVIHRQQRARTNWTRELRDQQTRLAAMVQTLIEALRLLKRDDTEATRLVAHLSGPESIDDFSALRDALLGVMRPFWAQARAVRARLREGREAERQFRLLLRRAEWELLDVRDEKLIDSTTGLPNRFALLAYLERAMQFHRDEAADFAIVVMLLDAYADQVKEAGRGRVNRWIRAWAARLVAEVAPGDYVARYNEETMVWVCSHAGESMDVAARMCRLLDEIPLEAEEAEPLTFKIGYGLVTHESGEGVESVVGLGLMAAQTALKEEGVPIQAAPPRQRTPAPSAVT